MSKTHTKPHIVHFSSVHQLEDIRIFVKECRTLAAAGYQVTLVARGDTSDTVDGVDRIAISQTAPGGRIGRMLLGTTRVVKRAWRENGDVYHFHDPELIPFGLFLKLRGKKVVYDAHENVREQLLSKPYLASWLKGPVAKVVGMIEDFAIRRFDGVVTATPHIADTLNTSHTITVANYPVADEITTEDTRHNRDTGKVVFVGGFTDIRGSREMVEAIGIVNQAVPARLVICGTMPSGTRAEVEELSGWQYVDDLGWQERSAARAQMTTAACGLCVYKPEPNHVEALPNKLFEYMAAGLPVVASNFPFWRQFVEETGAGVMVDPLDSQSIANGILEIFNDPDRAAQMGERGLRAVQERFNWDVESTKLVALMESVLQK